MTDARQIFGDLHEVAGQVFDTTGLRTDPDRIEARVARYRAGRAALASFAGLAVVGAMAFGLVKGTGPGDVGPATSPSSPSSSDASVEAADDPACNVATGISGKPLGNLGGLEGWWNSTPAAPCEEWDQAILDHPDTVTINTSDNTMVEAYYRTSIDALGVYADLGPDFAVPDPDPAWPADSIIVIDAATGEVLSSSQLSELNGLVYSDAAAQLADPSFYLPDEPWPTGAIVPTIEDIYPRTEGATVVWEKPKEIRYLSAEKVPGEFTVVKSALAVEVARDWHCAWLREYLWGAEDGDAQRTADALRELERFSQLPAIATYVPETGEAYDDELLEPLRSGDVATVSAWVARMCD